MVFFLSLAIVALYAIPQFLAVPATGPFAVSIWVAIAAGVTAGVSVALYFLTPNKPGFALALVDYLLFTVTAGLLVIQTGGVASPFVPLWLLVTFFAGVFSAWMIAPFLIGSGVFIAIEYLGGRFSLGLLAMAILVSILPLVLGVVIWRRQSEDQATKDTKKLASTLSEVANRSEIVINAIGDGVMAIDAQGIVQLINPAGQEILGWGKQDALMLHYKSVLKLVDGNGKELETNKDPVQQVLNTNQEVRDNDLNIVTKTGKKIDGAIVVSPVGQAGSGVITVFRDVTKEKAEEREQAEFISTASHEMRTPIASIEGFLGLALNPNTAQIDDKARGFIMKSQDAVKHLGRLFQDLLDVSKSEDGRMTNTPKVVNMSSFVEEIVQGLDTKAKEKGLQLIYKPTAASGQKQIPPVYYVNQDNDHIREVLDNLIENAIKYTPKGSVEVDVQGDDDKVIVSVKDSGLGIPAEDVPHLFQKFYRVDNKDRQDIGGTGLGLYLSRRLAEAMEGRLRVESTYQQGSTFFLELPRIDGTQAEQLKQQQALAAAQQPSQPVTAAPATPPTVPAPQPVQLQPVTSNVQTPTKPSVSGDIKPATEVPRGESLSREQIAEKARQLEAMARQQRVPERSAAPITVTDEPKPPAPTGQPQT